MAIPEKEKLIERLKAMSKEDRALFREALQETDPDSFLSDSEVSTIRKMLESKGKKKSLFTEIFGE